MTRPQAATSTSTLLLGLALLASPARGGDPPHDPSSFRGGPARTGDLGGWKLPAKAEVLWRVDIDRAAGQPVVAAGVVYLADGYSSLFAIKADGSEILRQDDEPGRFAYVAPLVVGERVYLSSSLGVSAHARATGLRIWQHPIPGGAATSSPLLAGGKVVVAGSDGFVHAVDPATGAPAWKHDIAGDAPADRRAAEIGLAGGGRAGPMTMASDGSTLFLPVQDQSRLVALDAATGGRRWAFRAGGPTFATPSVAGDDVFCSSRDKTMYCLDRKTGKVRWEFATGSDSIAGAAVRGGSAYFGSGGTFYRVDIKTGKQAWAFEAPKGDDGAVTTIASSPILDGDAVCFGALDGFAYAVGLETGALKWRARTAEGSEVSSTPCTDGRFVFLSVRANQLKNTGVDALVAIGEVPKGAAPAPVEKKRPFR